MTAPSESDPRGRPRGLRSTLRAAALPADHACASCEVRLQTFCAALAADELARFKALGSTGWAERGQSLFHEGDGADCVYNLTRGTVKLYKLLPDGRRQVAGFLHPGDFAGLTLGDDHAFTAEAIEDSEYCRFTRERFLAFVDSHPDMGRELYLIATHELAAAREQIVVLGRKTATERVASFLLGLFDRFRARNVDWEIVRMPMTRTDIADYLGLTKETVSRGVSELRRSGVIATIPGGRIELLQRHRLEQLSCGG